MVRLIDVDELLERSWRWAINSREAVQQMIKGCPTVDAVPVIRCKDCKYAKKIYTKNLPWLKQWEYSCRYFNTHSVMGDGFCSCAERKE